MRGKGGVGGRRGKRGVGGWGGIIIGGFLFSQLSPWWGGTRNSLISMPSVLSKNGRRRLTIYPPPNYDSNHGFREALTKIKPQFALELFTWIFNLLCVHTEVKIELKLSAVRDKQVLSQAERCPGHASTESNCPAQYGVKLITVQNNAKSS